MGTFYIKKNVEIGRFAVASLDINSGHFISDEYPFVIGPKPNSICCCLECYVPLDGTAYGSRCEKCSWPLCIDCKKITENSLHKSECEIFRKSNCKFINLKDQHAICIQLDCIMPLRMLIERESNPKSWNADVEPMMDHREKRIESETWRADEQNIVKYLLDGPCKLKKQEIDADLVQKIVGILEVNSFEAKTINGHSLRCLYPKLGVLSHSCTPNITHSIHPSKGYK